VRAELRKAHATLASGLVLVLRELLNERPIAIEDLWLLPDVVYGLAGPTAAPAGWIVLAGKEPRPRVHARETTPSWLTAAQSVSERSAAEEPQTAPPGASLRPARNFSVFRKEC
jgi:hypothetical protein